MEEKKSQPSQSQQLAPLTVIYGPMFSGKTGKIISMNKILRTLGYQVRILKPKIDQRYSGKAEINSHDQRSSTADLLDLKLPLDLFENLQNQKVTAVIIDEAQFFEKHSLLRFIHQCRKHQLRVIVAGLLYDYRRQPFGAMPKLLTEATESVELFAICQKCGRLAQHSERTAGGTGTIQVAAADQYIASCQHCHHIYQD
jgi:thymidine kinase